MKILNITALVLIVLGANASSKSARAETKQDSRPNIVFILADDLGWTDLGCFGSEYYETPHLDRLCNQGMKFTHAYSNGPNCAPTRASLMSGQYSPRHGVYTVGSPKRGKDKFRKTIPVKNRTVLPPSKTTVAELIQSAGYTTAHMGKWHLGDPPQAGPEQQGFDLNVAGDHRGHPPTYFSPYRNKYLEDGPKGEYLTDRLTDEALQFIEDNQDRPFFLYLPHYAVHTPIQGKKDLVKKYRKKPAADGHRNPTYAAMIESLDDSVGRIRKKLDELNLSQNTIVIFTSDNGGLGGYNDLNLHRRDITSNIPLKGGKGMLYEGGIRVPQIVYWPGVTQTCSVCPEPVITLDFYPTLLEMAGIQADPQQTLDGRSLVPLLKGEKSLSREAIYWHFPAYLQANVKRGTWRTTPASAIRQGDFKLIEFFEDGHLELYNLKKDISESQNLADKLPEKTQQLHRRLKKWRQSLDAPLPQPKKTAQATSSGK